MASRRSETKEVVEKLKAGGALGGSLLRQDYRAPEEKRGEERQRVVDAFLRAFGSQSIINPSSSSSRMKLDGAV